MKKILILSVASTLLLGCVSPGNNAVIKASDIQPNTFTYLDINASKKEIYDRANNYFASSYGDSREVIRAKNEGNGTLVGKGLAGWHISTGMITVECLVSYDITFVAKDGKARLQLELIEGAPAVSRCGGWPLPSIDGYEEILLEFRVISDGLENTLKGSGKIQALSDF